jgi:hypothetical protein
MISPICCKFGRIMEAIVSTQFSFPNQRGFYRGKVSAAKANTLQRASVEPNSSSLFKLKCTPCAKLVN